ncbi:MAG: hypothetical protein R6V62_08545 [Candidatus Fermentibacteraceae bacterium]
MSISGDWRDRHSQRSSGSRVVFYIILLAVTVILILKAGDFSRGFTDVFLKGNTTGEPN